MYSWVKPKYPGGGAFAVQIYSLKYLYDQWVLHNNIWTKSNDWTDLCRYLYCTITVYRHPRVDFILHYDRQPPFNNNYLTYQNYHPYMLLQMKHKKIIPSLLSNPRGKPKLKIKIKPPKQMLSKWFFQKQFSNYDLLLLVASAASLKYPRLACCNENRIITLLYLHPNFFKQSDWAQTRSETQTPPYYEPYPGAARIQYLSGRQDRPTKYTPIDYIDTATAGTPSGKYYKSIDLEGGFFSPKVLGAFEVKTSEGSTRPLPIGVARYNPAADDGKGNVIWLCSIFGGSYDKPRVTPDLIIEGEPLWKAFWGYWSYLEAKKKKSFFALNLFVVQSPHIHPAPTEATRQFYPIIDRDFIQGKNAWDSYITLDDKKFWYPTCHRQTKTINDIVKCGPYVPKLDNITDSTWELPISYNFRFKWGGPMLQDNQVINPQNKDTYPVPDTIKEAVQVLDPEKQIAASMFHQWDYRRGCLTEKAIKRMSQNLPTDSSLESDTESTPKKKRRILPTLHNPEEETQEIQKCLLSLCEESTCQEQAQEQDLLKLIKQQQQQQHELKHNLLVLIKDLKAKQRLLQLQTGVLE